MEFVMTRYGLGWEELGSSFLIFLVYFFYFYFYSFSLIL